MPTVQSIWMYCPLTLPWSIQANIEKLITLLNSIIYRYNLEHLFIQLNFVSSKEIFVFYVRKTDYSNVTPVMLAILSNKTWYSISKPFATLLQLLSGFLIFFPSRKLWCKDCTINMELTWNTLDVPQFLLLLQIGEF